eukprot:Gb_00754 [translate_table: standard]
MEGIVSMQLQGWRSPHTAVQRSFTRSVFPSTGRQHFPNSNTEIRTRIPRLNWVSTGIAPISRDTQTYVISSKQETQNGFSGFNKSARVATAILSEWFSSSDETGLVNKSRYGLKVRIREASLLVLTAALVILNANARLCRPALADTGHCCSPPATTEPLQTPNLSESSTEAKPDETVVKETTPSDRAEDLSLSPASEQGFRNGSEEKEAMVSEYLKTHPNDTRALKILLQERMTNGDVGRAVEVLDRMILVEPYEIEWKMLKAQAHYYLGELEEARQAYKKILKFTPLSPGALQGLAMVMKKCGEEDAIVPMLEGALQRAASENQTEVVQNLKLLLGEYYILQKNYQEALRNYEDLVKEDPEDFRPYLWQGIIYNILEKEDEADKQFEKYQKLVSKKVPNKELLDNLFLDAKTRSDQQDKEENGEAESLVKRDELPKPFNQSSEGGDILHASNESGN